MVRDLPDGTRWVDLELLAQWLGRSRHTVRLRCQPVACDVRTRRSLYDPAAASETLAAIPKRPRAA
jgi:hypothetical protein